VPTAAQVAAFSLGIKQRNLILTGFIVRREPMSFGNRGPARDGAKTGQPAAHREVVARPRKPEPRLPTYAELSRRQPGEISGSLDGSSQAARGPSGGSGSSLDSRLIGPGVAIALFIGYQMVSGVGVFGVGEGRRANAIPTQSTQISRPKRTTATDTATDRESADPISRSVDRAMNDSDVQRARRRMDENSCRGEQRMTFSCEREMKEAADDYARAIQRSIR
jgi:hypothetical protein